MSKLFKRPKAPVMTPLSDPNTVTQQAAAQVEADKTKMATDALAIEKDTKRRYGQSGRAGTVLSSGGGLG